MAKRMFKCNLFYLLNILQKHKYYYKSRFRGIRMKYRKIKDGWFTYYVNVETGEKKFKLDAGDILVEPDIDDFAR